MHAAEQQRADVVAARLVWQSLRPRLDPRRLVLIDETGTATNMARRHGRCRRGSRLTGRVPHGHWKTTTFVAGSRVNAVTAPFVIDRAKTGEIFRAYVKCCLVPTLSPGDIVIMDNLPAHEVAGLRNAIAAAGAMLLYLPPYSPDFNPIEMLFAKLKALLRRAAERTIPSLVGRHRPPVGQLLCRRVLPLSRPCWIRLNLSGNRSSSSLRKLAYVTAGSLPCERGANAGR